MPQVDSSSVPLRLRRVVRACPQHVARQGRHRRNAVDAAWDRGFRRAPPYGPSKGPTRAWWALRLGGPRRRRNYRNEIESAEFLPGLPVRTPLRIARKQLVSIKTKEGLSRSPAHRPSIFFRSGRCAVRLSALPFGSLTACASRCSIRSGRTCNTSSSRIYKLPATGQRRSLLHYRNRPDRGTMWEWKKSPKIRGFPCRIGRRWTLDGWRRP